GRAEWIKAMAALTGAAKRAGRVFRTIEKDYGEAAAKAAAAGVPGEVLAGEVYQGRLSRPSGGSHEGKPIDDAGDAYPVGGDKGTGSLRLSFEAVYAKGGDARTWLVGEPWTSTADALRADRRYGKLDAVTEGTVWTNTRATGPGGGNDFYERGVLRPDLVLADLFAILHPDRAADHTFTFYAEVPRA